jgi:high-affinity nickel-transport protein
VTTRRKIATMYALLIGGNVAVWALAFIFFAPQHALLLGTALLAYTFGLRHAVDADHISAIDNVTRKLMQDGKRPVGVGFFFSLGHSTIVVVLTLAIVAGATAIKGALPSLEGLGSILGTSISATFLFIIAAINAFVLVDIVRGARQATGDETADEALARRGLLGRIFKPVLRLVTRSRDMYLIGLLFGLGFDTATEVGLLGIAAIEAGKGLPVVAILLFPALFAAGMSLVDTTDGILMLGAYGWAFINPARKFYYNVTITGASVLVAVLVGGVELASVAGGSLQVGWLGVAIIAILAAVWLVAMALHTARGTAPNEPASAQTYDS